MKKIYLNLSVSVYFLIVGCLVNIFQWSIFFILFILCLSSKLFKNCTISEPEFSRMYLIPINQNSDNELLILQIYPIHFHLIFITHLLRIHFAFTSHSVILRWYYGDDTVILRWWYGLILERNIAVIIPYSQLNMFLTFENA